MVALTFAAAFGTLAISFWPYMIPFSITIDAAAAPHSSLAFMFWGEGLFVFPLMLVYAAVNYSVFRGKVAHTPQHYCITAVNADLPAPLTQNERQTCQRASTRTAAHSDGPGFQCHGGH